MLIWDKETQTFWSVAVRYLRKRLDKDQVLIPNVIDDVTTTKVDDQVMQLVFREKLKLSARLWRPSITTNIFIFALCFGAWRVGVHSSDARQLRDLLAPCLERVMGDSSSENFDDKLKRLLLRPIRNSPLNFSIQRTKGVACLCQIFRRYRPFNCQCFAW